MKDLQLSLKLTAGMARSMSRAFLILFIFSGSAWGSEIHEPRNSDTTRPEATGGRSFPNKPGLTYQFANLDRPMDKGWKEMDEELKAYLENENLCYQKILKSEKNDAEGDKKLSLCLKELEAWVLADASVFICECQCISANGKVLLPFRPFSPSESSNVPLDPTKWFIEIKGGTKDERVGACRADDGKRIDVGYCSGMSTDNSFEPDGRLQCTQGAMGIARSILFKNYEASQEALKELGWTFPLNMAYSIFDRDLLLKVMTDSRARQALEKFKGRITVEDYGRYEKPQLPFLSQGRDGKSVLHLPDKFASDKPMGEVLKAYIDEIVRLAEGKPGTPQPKLNLANAKERKLPKDPATVTAVSNFAKAVGTSPEKAYGALTELSEQSGGSLADALTVVEHDPLAQSLMRKRQSKVESPVDLGQKLLYEGQVSYKQGLANQYEEERTNKLSSAKEQKRQVDATLENLARRLKAEQKALANAESETVRRNLKREIDRIESEQRTLSRTQELLEYTINTLPTMRNPSQEYADDLRRKLEKMDQDERDYKAEFVPSWEQVRRELSQIAPR